MLMAEISARLLLPPGDQIVKTAPTEEPEDYHDQRGTERMPLTYTVAHGQKLTSDNA
jgi:hypothetical protein